MSVAVDDHAVQRFRERFPGLCRHNPDDTTIRQAILACLDTASPPSISISEKGDRIETVRTRHPFVLRVVLLPVPEGRRVLTVLRGDKGKGDRAGQKARRKARQAQEAACVRF